MLLFLVLLFVYVVFCLGIFVVVFFFFFQAEDGIRDKLVTGVQTCALPISALASLVVKAAAFAGVEDTPKQLKTVDEYQKDLENARKQKAAIEKDLDALRKELLKKPEDESLLDRKSVV